MDHNLNRLPGTEHLECLLHVRKRIVMRNHRSYLHTSVFNQLQTFFELLTGIADGAVYVDLAADNLSQISWRKLM